MSDSKSEKNNTDSSILSRDEIEKMLDELDEKKDKIKKIKSKIKDWNHSIYLLNNSKQIKELKNAEQILEESLKKLDEIRRDFVKNQEEFYNDQENLKILKNLKKIQTTMLEARKDVEKNRRNFEEYRKNIEKSQIKIDDMKTSIFINNSELKIKTDSYIKYKKLCKELIKERYERDIEIFNNFSEGLLKISLNNPLEKESWESKHDYDEFILHNGFAEWYDVSNNKKILSIIEKDDNTNYLFKECDYSSSKSKKVSDNSIFTYGDQLVIAYFDNSKHIVSGNIVYENFTLRSSLLERNSKIRHTGCRYISRDPGFLKFTVNGPGIIQLSSYNSLHDEDEIFRIIISKNNDVLEIKGKFISSSKDFTNIDSEDIPSN